MAQAYVINPEAPHTMQYYEYPSNVPLKGRLRHWKYFKDGIILDHAPLGDVNARPSRCFHYIDSKKKPAFIQLGPSLEFQLQ
jgi:hypothetical protein